jgi:tetratricopeptide (TPR) repeat protein
VIPAGTEILAKEPNNTVAYFKRGKAYLDNRNVRELDLAIADLTKAIEIQPSYAQAYGERGVAYLRKKDHPRAIVNLSKAIELDPSLARAYRMRGVVYQMSQRDSDLALADYSKAIELEPAVPDNYVLRYFVHAAKGDIGSAIDDLETALKLGFADRSEDIDVGHYDHIRLLDKAIARNDQDAIAYFGRGWAYETKQEWEGAIYDYTMAIERDPALVAAYIHRGKAYAKRHDGHRLALADFNKAIELDPKNPLAYLARGEFYFTAASNRSTADAFADITKAIELDPKLADAYWMRGMMHVPAKEWAAAKADFAKAIDLNWTISGWLQPWANLLDEIERERQTAPR